jgi:hypothetical protein
VLQAVCLSLTDNVERMPKTSMQVDAEGIELDLASLKRVIT